jgi:FMNH2-dependent dimethyl sulfone monooxygenase
LGRANAMFNDNVMKLGLFAPNCRGALAITTVPESWDASWEHNAELARLCDEAGIEFILPIARWKGYGGASRFEEETLETMTWATGLLAQTERLCVFATVHAPLIHPIVAAKQMVTIDHISRGRFGLNLVCGWNQDEFEMFGHEQREHDERYVYGQEWLDVVRLIWRSEERTDFDGRYFHLKEVIGRPAPYDGEPVLVNAGFSPAGRAFAQRNCDFLFTSLVDLESAKADVDGVNAAAAAMGREIGVLAAVLVVCRPTEAEAREYLHHYSIQHGDWEAADRLMAGMGMHGQSFPPGHYERFRERFTAGHGSYPLVGTPDQIADELERIAQTGMAGLAFGMVNFLEEMPYFCQEVLPRLEAKGLRRPVQAVTAA